MSFLINIVICNFQSLETLQSCQIQNHDTLHMVTTNSRTSMFNKCCKSILPFNSTPSHLQNQSLNFLSLILAMANSRHRSCIFICHTKSPKLSRSNFLFKHYNYTTRHHKYKSSVETQLQANQIQSKHLYYTIDHHHIKKND